MISWGFDSLSGHHFFLINIYKTISWITSWLRRPPFYPPGFSYFLASIYHVHTMNDHHRSEKARAYVREYVEQRTQLIQAWLEGSGALEEVGAELISSEVEKFHLNGEPDLRGLAGPYIERIFREAPGGELAARQYLAKCIASGHGVPRQLEKLCSELLLEKPIGANSTHTRSRRGPKSRNARRDLLIWTLIRVLQVHFGLTKRTNDARADDFDVADSALEIIRDELAIVDPEIGKISLKRLHNAAQKFAADNDWFTY